MSFMFMHLNNIKQLSQKIFEQYDMHNNIYWTTTHKNLPIEEKPSIHTALSAQRNEHFCCLMSSPRSMAISLPNNRSNACHHHCYSVSVDTRSFVDERHDVLPFDSPIRFPSSFSSSLSFPCLFLLSFHDSQQWWSLWMMRNESSWPRIPPMHNWTM